MGSYEEIKMKCLSERKLWVDPEFGANAASIRPTLHFPEDWIWKRPKDIVPNPKFIIDGATRFDLCQGDLGDCWFVSAAAVMATKPDIFKNVIPQDQSFVKEYAGLFRFRFWRFGKWVEVLVDDQLPVDVDGQLKYGRNRSQGNEFWGALLEKAYAKVHGSYSAIHQGHARDPLVDFTGGISETYNLKHEDDIPPNLWHIISKSHQVGSLLCSSILNASGATKEEELSNGLYKGHAYSVTGIIDRRIAGWQVKLLRMRNPWGCKEWIGAWGDRSDEWKAIPDEEKKAIGLTFEDDGEFWISYEDWSKSFDILEIVHMGPDSFARLGYPQECVQWQESAYLGRWVKGVNSGGSGLFSSTKDLYYSNPQYFMTLTTEDDDDVAGECTCIVSLMQVDYRRRRTNPALKKLIVGFDVHFVKTGAVESLQDETFFDKTKLKKQFFVKTPMREISCRLQLDPGLYCIIPVTLRAGQEAEFLLRVYTYSKVEFREIREETGPLPPSDDKPPSRPVGNLSADLFWQYAGEDHVVDARDLRDLINQLARNEIGETTSFSTEACRALISMYDRDTTGTLDYEQMGTMWDEILFWRKIYTKFDRDKSGCIDTLELKKVFKELGFTLSLETLTTLSVRYGGKDRQLFFEDYILCVTKFLTMYTIFKHHRDKSAEGQVIFGFDEWMRTTLAY